MNRQRHRDRVDAVNARLSVSWLIEPPTPPTPRGMTRAEFVDRCVANAGRMGEQRAMVYAPPKTERLR